MNILLGHLGSNGDCLYATALAKQIKQDFPGCHLTFAIGSLARPVLANNPDIDAVWEIAFQSWVDMPTCWHIFEREAMRLHNTGAFDRMFMTQISPSRFANYDGTIRPSIFRNFGRPVTVPVDAYIYLDEGETARVDRWVADSVVGEASPAILFECSSKSGQSFVTPAWATQVAEAVLARHPKAVCILSTHETIASSHPRIISAAALSMRENTRLTHFVDLFVGCGSGLTVVATCSAAKPALPTIQILRRETSMYASFRHDFAHFGKSTDPFLEITRADAQHTTDAICSTIEDGFARAKGRFDDPIPLTFDWYIELMRATTLDRGAFTDAAASALVTMERYGPVPQLINYARAEILPFVDDDPLAIFPDRPAMIEKFKALVSST